MIGSTMRQKVWKRLQPSTSEASSSSIGTWRNIGRSTIRAKASVFEVVARITAGNVFRMSSVRKMMNIGVASSASGKTCSSSTSMIATSTSRVRSRLIA